MAGPAVAANAAQEQDPFTRDYAASLDAADPLSKFRSNFYIPTLADLKRTTLAKSPDESPSPPCTYLCGNSLGLQPTRTADLINAFLTQWRTKAVTGHFVEHDDSPLPPFLDIDDHAAKLMAPIVGARHEEVAVMGSLTGNLHLLMSSFYRPSKKGEGRWKILLEGKAFPSDHVRSFNALCWRNRLTKKPVCCSIADCASRTGSRRGHGAGGTRRPSVSNSAHYPDPENHRRSCIRACVNPASRHSVLHRPILRHSNHHRSCSFTWHLDRLGLCSRRRKHRPQTA